MAENDKFKKVKTRLQLKHDVAGNWQEAAGFIPWPGEIVIYDEENSPPPAKIKVGDGETPVNELNFINTADIIKTGEVLASESHTHTFKGVPKHSLMNLYLNINSSEHSLSTWQIPKDLPGEMTTPYPVSTPASWGDYGIVEIRDISMVSTAFASCAWQGNGEDTLYVKKAITGTGDASPTTNVYFNLTKTVQEQALGLPCLIGRSESTKTIYLIYVDYNYAQSIYDKAQIKCSVTDQVLSYSLEVKVSEDLSAMYVYNFNQISVPNDFYFESFGLLNCTATAIADTYIYSSDWRDDVVYSGGATVVLRNTTDGSSTRQTFSNCETYYLSMPNTVSDLIDLSVEIQAGLVPFSYELRLPYEETLKVLEHASPLINSTFNQKISWGTSDPTDSTPGQIYFKYK